MKISLIFVILFVYAHCDEENQGPSYSTPLPSGEVHFAEPFDSDDSIEGWVHSKAKKDGVDSEIAKYDGKWKIKALSENALEDDTGLVLEEKARHHAISSLLDRPYKFEGKSFVLQYEVNFQTGIECGGAYVKLLSQTDGLDLESFHDKTSYTIMFGPDKCGEDYKLHFIFRHKNPVTGEYEEKHANNKPTGVDLKKYYSDKATHLYTLVVEPDNTFEIFIDQTLVNSGSLLNDVSPPVNPPKEIVDVEDKKPEDWDERETIADPDSVKPEDWDEDAPAQIMNTDAEMPDGWLEEESLYVDDEDAVMPDDWDEEMDGEWEAPKVDNPRCKSAPGCGPWEPPLIDNPEYKGRWSAPQIPNPAYKGIWKPRMIPNPGYFEDNNPYAMTTIGAVGFELWSMSENIYFDNILIADDKNVADDYADKTWKLKQIFKTSNEPGVVTNLLSATEEKPWLWIIYVFVVALPLVLIFVFCCKRSKKDDPKKTDEPTPDDPHDSNNEEDKDEENEEAKDDEEEKGKTDDETNDSDKVKDGEGDGDMVKITKADLEKENDDVDEAEDLTEDLAQTRKSPRKRKPRVQD